MPTVRISKKTLKSLREVQGYLQMSTGKKITDDQTVAELSARFRKIFPVQIGKKTVMLEIDTEKRYKR